MGNTDSSPEELAKTKGSGESLGSLRKFATTSNKDVDWSSYDIADTGVEFDINSDDGKKRLNALKESIGSELQENPELIHFICTASLVFRNGDMKTAAQRVHNYLAWRGKYLGTYEKIILEKLKAFYQNIYKRNNSFTDEECFDFIYYPP